MQRPTYPLPGPANSPPLLHHPVPQHVSTVPQLRSPPPPNAQNGYGYDANQQQQQANGQPAGGAGYMHPAFGGFMNDPAAQMGLQMGQSAMKVGQEYVEHNLGRYVNVSALKHYFNVTNRYVLAKLLIVLFPWRHRPWSRQHSLSHPTNPDNNPSNPPTNPPTLAFLPPREDLNSPDMYIPLMAFTTYILLSTLLAGLSGNFQPQLLGITFTNATSIILLELVFLWLGRYLLNIHSESQIYDLVAYSGYKFVGVILRSLKYVLLPPPSPTPGNPNIQTLARSQRTTRTYFLFGYSYVVQFAFMWWLTAVDVGGAVGSSKSGGGGGGKKTGGK
ncbi:hypothetical protein LTR08_000617 [Meristemomyces frigidus]|nr:hypothetical protein LTR08_000617 [Meristemomyces frigidus]